MSYKHYFPTFRARWRFLRAALAEVGQVVRALHIGCGEGDHNLAIKAHAETLVACDLNPGDIAHARALHAGTAGIEYRVEDGTALQLPDRSFDLVVCMEVIEHVGDPQQLLREIARVLAPGGRCILTCPSARFPVTYDPINFVLQRLGTHVPIGAYAFGHYWLVREESMRHWCRAAGLHAQREQRLTGWLVGATECYWLGLVHRIVKPNSRNSSGAATGMLRPNAEHDPVGVGLVDAFVAADARVGAHSQYSVGLGYVLERVAS